MEWYLWMMAGLTYLGLGKLTLTGMEAILKHVNDRDEKEYKGFQRLPAWVIVLFWPLFGLPPLMFVGLVLVVAGVIVAAALSIIGIVIAVVVALIALAFGFVVAVVLSAVILSPVSGIGAIKGIVTKLHPSPLSEKKEEKQEGQEEE